MSLNPMFWLNLRINGSVSGNFVVVGVFFFLIAALAGTSYYFNDPRDHGNIDGVWLAIVSAAQALFVLILTPAAVRKAVLRDFQTGMIASHRISPMSNLKVVLGYLTGAPVQPFMLYGAGLILGSVFVSRFAWTAQNPVLGSVPAAMGGWLVVHACVLMLAALIASLVLLSALATEGKANFAGPLIIAAMMGGWALLFYVPGIALIIGLMGGSAVLAVLQGNAARDSLQAILLGAALQLPLSLIFIAASCRKFRRPWEAMFSVPLAFLLLAFLGFAFVLGIALAPKLETFSDAEGGLAAQIGASIAVFMIFTFVPLMSAASAMARADAAAAFESPEVGARRRYLLAVPLLVCAVTAAVLFGMLRVATGDLPAHLDELIDTGRLWIPAVTVVALAAIADLAVCYALILRRKRIFWPLVFIVFALRILPVILNGAAVAIQSEVAPERVPSLGLTGASSPFGTLAMLLWGGEAAVLWTGVAIQALVCGLCVAWALRARAKLFRESSGAGGRNLPAITPA